MVRLAAFGTKHQRLLIFVAILHDITLAQYQYYASLLHHLHQYNYTLNEHIRRKKNHSQNTREKDKLMIKLVLEYIDFQKIQTKNSENYKLKILLM